MPSDEIIAEVIRFLEAEQAKGRKRVFLEPATARALFAPAAVPRVPAATAAAAGAAIVKPVQPVTHAAASPTARRESQTPVLPSTVTAGAWTPPPAGAGDLDLRQETLATLPALVAACRRCGLCQQRRQTVFADGDPNARLMFVGEGPGEEEDIQGKPFVGKAGQLLTRMIEAMHLQRDQVYIANIVKCRPPGNRVPQEDEAKACLPFLARQIELVKPAAMVVLGATPFLYLLGRKGLTQLRGNWHEYRGIPVMPTFHPAYLLRVPERKREVWADLQQVMARLGL